MMGSGPFPYTLDKSNDEVINRLANGEHTEKVMGVVAG